MPRPKAKAPTRQYHLSGQSVVRLDGREFYLGKHDSPEAIARYAVLVGIYQQNGLKMPEDFELDQIEDRVGVMLGAVPATALATDQTSQPILVSHVTALFREHVREKYKNTPQERRRNLRLADQLDAKFGSVTVEQFGPVKLREFRDDLVSQGLARKYVNRLVNCVIQMFRHGVAGELITVAKVQQLQTLEPLRKGQTKAPETEAVEPANLEHVRATAKHLSPVVKAMLRVQIATGARPKEVCMMRPCDIDRSGEVWVYKPSEHKTDWVGKAKHIPLVGDARAAVEDYLNRDPQAYCFSPAESMAWRRAVGTAKRKTPKNQGNRPGTNRKENPKRVPRERYDAASYRQAIERAAKKAGVDHWHPYQLRHLTATAVRAVLGIEDAKALLGHSTALMTAHYARESVEAATRAAKVAPTLFDGNN